MSAASESSLAVSIIGALEAESDTEQAAYKAGCRETCEGIAAYLRDQAAQFADDCSVARALKQAALDIENDLRVP